MSFTAENLAAAAQILSERQAKAEKTQRARHEEITKKIPDIVRCEAELSACGFATMKALGMGENADKFIEELSRVNLATQKIIKEKLRENGYPEDYLETPYTCRKCNDTGFVGGYGCSCRRQLLIELGIKDLESVSPAAKCRFDNFDISLYDSAVSPEYGISPREKLEDILQYAKCYAEDFDTHSCSLYFSGATGLGKTHLSLAIANAVVRKGFNVIYGSAQNIVSQLEKEKFSNNSTGENEKKILDCDLLIIDDLGSEFATQFTVTALYNILNTRLNLSKPVIISTNLSEKELEAKYTQRITSRIIGNYTPLMFIGRDIRQIKASF